MPDKRSVIVSLWLFVVCQASLAESPEANGFRMPYPQVLKMTPDQFVTVYARKKGDSDPFSPSGATYRNGMNYYAQCLRLRTHLRERTLSSERQRQLNRFRSALSHWETQYLLLHGSGMGGTAWANIWEDDQIAQETTFSQVEVLLHRRMRPAHDSDLLDKQISTLLREINRSDIHSDAAWMKVHEIDQVRHEARDATAALKQAANALPVSCGPTIVKCLQKINSNVQFNATPTNG